MHCALPHLPPLPLSGLPDYQVEATAAEDEAEPQWEREGAGLPTPRGPCRAGSIEGMFLPPALSPLSSSVGLPSHGQILSG